MLLPLPRRNFASGNLSGTPLEFLNMLDAAYPAVTAIKIILDNHSAHVSQETKAWLAARPEGRFQFVFTPKHGSWLNLVEEFFAKAARSVLRHIRVGSKYELKQRIMSSSMISTATRSSTDGTIKSIPPRDP